MRILHRTLGLPELLGTATGAAGTSTALIAFAAPLDWSGEGCVHWLPLTIGLGLSLAS